MFYRLLSIIVLLCLTSSAHAIKTKYPSSPVCLIQTSYGKIYVELYEKDAPKTVKNFIGLAEGLKTFTDPKTKKKVKRPFYDGLIFHRVIPNFMIQGGCPLGNGTGNPGYQFEDEINAFNLKLDQIKAISNGKVHRFLGVSNKQDFSRIILRPLSKKMGIKSEAEFIQRRQEFNALVAKLTLKDCYENLGYVYNDKLFSHQPDRGVIAMANSGPNTNGSQFFITLMATPWLAGKHTVFGKIIKGMDVVDTIAHVKTDPENNRPLKNVTIQSIRLFRDK